MMRFQKLPNLKLFVTALYKSKGVNIINDSGLRDSDSDISNNDVFYSKNEREYNRFVNYV
jgi:hypothetical protein